MRDINIEMLPSFQERNIWKGFLCAKSGIYKMHVASKAWLVLTLHRAIA